MEKIILLLKGLSLRFYEKYKVKFGEDKKILETLNNACNAAEEILTIGATEDNYIRIAAIKSNLADSLASIITKLRQKSLRLGYDEFLEEYINRLQEFGNALTGLALRKMENIKRKRRIA